MQITVLVHPRAKNNLVKIIDHKTYRVEVVAPPSDNRANLAIIEVLADYFKLRKNQIRLIRGAKNKVKIFEIIP